MFYYWADFPSIVSDPGAYATQWKKKLNDSSQETDGFNTDQICAMNHAIKHVTFQCGSKQSKWVYQNKIKTRSAVNNMCCNL